MALPEARQHVEQLAADCRAGRPVPAFADFLLRTCAPSAQGWLVSVLFGASIESVDVYDVQPYPVDLFQRSCLFWARATGVAMATTTQPSGDRMALFSFGPDGYRLLSRRRAELARLLDQDGRPLDDYDPPELGRVLLDVLANQGPYTHTLLTAADTLRAAVVARGVSPDSRELARCCSLVSPPQCSGDEQQGWSLECFTLYGHLHDKRSLCRLRYHITCSPGSYRRPLASFQIRERIEVISDRLGGAIHGSM